MANTCSLEVKTLKSQKYILTDVSLDETVSEIYDRVGQVEDTPTSKWKMMLVAKSVMTLRRGDGAKLLREYGAESDQQYRVEVILDMGACHTTCAR